MTQYFFDLNQNKTKKLNLPNIINGGHFLKIATTHWNMILNTFFLYFLIFAVKLVRLLHVEKFIGNKMP